MRILACFKVTPDYEALRESDWAAAASATAPAAGETPGVDTRFVRRVLDCFDESALELVLRLAEQRTRLGGASSLGAVTIGGAETEPQLKTLLALGYGQAARVHTGAALDFAPALTASAIAGFVQRRGPWDLVLMGALSGPGDGGTVPFRVSEELDWPCVTQVTAVEPLPDDRIRVSCTADDGLVRLTVRTPCVLAIGNAVVSHLRVPTLTDRLATRDTKPDVVHPADLGVDLAAGLGGEPAALVSLESIERRRPGLVIEGATPREKARALLDSRLAELLETL
jgi:electron transfer flavoprotein beta subunit